jgi:hypothetical protein
MKSDTKVPNKKEIAFQKMVRECVRNSNARRKDPKEHAMWREQYALMLKTGEKPLPSLSNKIAGGCYNKSIDESKWRNTYNDDPELKAREKEAQKEVDNKRLRIAPAYSKGNYQYITDLKDLPTLGKKV